MRLMHLARFVFAALPGFLCSNLAIAQDTGSLSGPSVNQACMECGVIYEIKAITSEREVARTLEETASPMGPFINIPLTRNPSAKPQIGAIGDKKMRNQLERTVYEIVVRFDDDRFVRVEASDVSGLNVGDRVRVQQNRVEPVNPP